MSGSSENKDSDNSLEEIGNQAEDQQKTQLTTNGKSPKETGGPKGLEPTRYGDWEKAGRCIDF